jgi:hypothetical protein
VRLGPAALGVALVLLLITAAPAAHAQTSTVTATVTTTTTVDPNKPVGVTDLEAAQPGYRLKGKQVQAIAERNARVQQARRKYPGNYPGVYTKGPGRWQVSWFSRDKPPKEIAQVYVDDRTGKVTEAWTGFYVPWTMARGYAGAFGRKVNSPWVWIPLTLIFLAGLLDWRRPLRLLNLDLVVLAAFGISVAYFNDANVDTSVPVLFPMMAYVLGRMLWVGFRTRPEGDDAARGRPLRMLLPAPWMAVVVIFLVGFRIGLNITDSNVIDVGYAGVIGGDHVIHGERLYGNFPKDNEHGDTYGPVNYIAYVPFVAAFGWDGRWDDLPAAHAAAIFFDLLALLLCFLLGRRIRGPSLGVALAFAWAAYPFTLYSLACNANDTLVAVFVLAAVWAAGTPPARGAFAALGGLTKFGSLGLAPLLMTYTGEGERLQVRNLARYLLGFGVAAGLAMLPIAFSGDSLSDLWDRTIGYQAGREAPFSIWGLYDLDTLQSVWQALAVALAIGAALLPRRRDLIGLAALSGAVLIALQLGITYWFYLYIVWFFPLVMAALLGRGAEPATR